MMNDKIINALEWRYAVQEFDNTKKVSDEDFKTILESGRLAPSPFGVEPWVFVVVENKDLRMKMHDEASPQQKVTEADRFVVIARRTDTRANTSDERIARTVKATGAPAESFKGLKDMIDGVVAGKSDEELDAWAAYQAFVPLGMMIETAALLGVDAGPMEGFSKEGFDQILGLTDRNLASVVAIGFGYRGDDSAAARPKVRRDFDDAVLVIS